MNLSMFVLHNQSVTSRILDSITKRLHEAEIAPEDALDELVLLDPETMLGRAMTDVMVHITSLDLLDFYLGYDRVGSMIKIYMSKDANPESLKQLVDNIEQEIETPPIAADERTPLISAKLYRSNLDDEDFTWILELRVYQEAADEYGNVPVDVDLSGNIEPEGEETSEETPEEVAAKEEVT